MSKSKLYVIKQIGQDHYWCNSAIHGCGWTLRYPKQAFSRSELLKEISLALDKDYFTSIEIWELRLPDE